MFSRMSTAIASQHFSTYTSLAERSALHASCALRAAYGVTAPAGPCALRTARSVERAFHSAPHTALNRTGSVGGSC